MRLNRYVDVLIPRGGAGLIRSVVENSTVPVIETGTGNCHIFVDETADFNMALDIIYNAKTQRIGVCNACESLIVHRKIADQFLPLLKKRLAEKEVEVRADEAARAVVPEFTPATEEDWGTEYLDYILSLKIVRLCRRGQLNISINTIPDILSLLSHRIILMPRSYLDEVVCCSQCM